jgi:hypothetical protein
MPVAGMPVAEMLRCAPGCLLPCRFVCRKRLGGRKGEPAAYLTPVPPNAVVYGSGETARVITKVRVQLQDSPQDSLKASSYSIRVLLRCRLARFQESCSVAASTLFGACI